MKSITSILITATIAFAALATPLRLAAQDGQNQRPKHHHYKLIDVGTLGGPNSYLPLLPPYHDFLPSASLSRSGTFAGSADTATADPYSPFCFNGDCFVSHAVAWRNGTITDLGALPGPAGSSSAATWISKNGLIAGVSENGEIDPLVGIPVSEGVLWKNGNMINLGTLEGGYQSQAMAVNNSGQVVGLASNLVPDPNSLLGTTTQWRAFLWENGAMQDLGTLPGGTDAMALFVNERGQIVGQSYAADSIVPPPSGTCVDSPLTLHSFFWDNGQMTDLGTFGGHCTFPYSLNNRGQVVGQSNLAGDSTSHPFLWHRGKIKDLGTLGGTYGFAEWLNDAGTVVGSAGNQGDQALLAFVWEKGAMTNLGTLPGNACSAADAINSAGQIVGGSGFFDAPFFPACTDPVEHAVLWENGQIFDLNNFVPLGTDLTLTEAFFINDHGEISGFGTLSNGNQHAFLLIPCDEHHSSVEGCEYNIVDEAAATRERPAPAMQMPAGAIQSNSVRQMLRQRLGLRYHIPGPTSGARVISGPNVTLSPTSLTFSTQAIGTMSAAKTVTLKNTGTASLTISSIAIIGTDAGDFSQATTCGASLAAGANCKIRVKFTPTVSGMRTAAVSITDSAAGSPQQVPLSGIGTTAKLSPTTLSFGTVAIDTASPAKTVTLTNVGMTTFTITAIAITGTNAGDFAQTHTCGSSLAAGASCTVSVTFKPTQIGKRTGTLSVTDNAPGSPQKVTLSGIGTTAELSPTSLDFGSVAVGTTSPAKTVTLTNVGTTTLSITGIAITGTNAGDFAETHTCGSSLAARASCTASVTFRPSATGSLSGTLSVTDNAPGSPQTVSLSGTGAAGRCSPAGMECPPQFPPCCPGLTCQLRGNRAFCEPKTPENTSSTSSFWNQVNSNKLE